VCRPRWPVRFSFSEFSPAALSKRREDKMRHDNQAAHLFAALGQGQGIATANITAKRIARLALVLVDALSSTYARLERSLARPLLTRVAVRPRVDDVVVKREWAAGMRGFHVHSPRLGVDQRLWLLSCRMSPVMCPVS
jgi:hypothetical protein